MTDDEARALRRTHRVLETFHGFIYFAPEAPQRYATLGIQERMRGYFASRSAAFGQVPAEVVISSFYNFAPSRVRAAIPSVWEVTTPQQVLEARYDAVDAALRRVLGNAVTSTEMSDAMKLARAATEAADIVGRPLYAAHASLPWPDQPHLALWHATTLLREHRGDGHIAALVLAGLSGAEAAVTHAATGAVPEEVLRLTRGYSEEDWAAVKSGLQNRGLLDEAGALTEAGAALRAEVERQTDAAASAPYRHLGEEPTQRLVELVRPWSRALVTEINPAAEISRGALS
jgi:hypothetical protein